MENNKKGSLSISIRIALSATVLICIFLPAVFFSIQNAYEKSLTQAKQEELKTIALSLISEFEFVNDAIGMPQQLFVESLNLPSSGYYGYIFLDDGKVWQSLSTITQVEQARFSLSDVIEMLDNIEQTTQSERQLTLGNPLFSQEQLNSSTNFLYAYKVEFQRDEKFTPVTFVVLNSKVAYSKESSLFMQNLTGWLVLLSIVLLSLVYLVLWSVFKPMKHIISQIRDAEKGKIKSIEQQYPKELQQLKLSINTLLFSERQQKLKYKHSLDDLAHSIKTPLAVLTGMQQMPKDARQPIKQIDNIVRRQLKRATINAIGTQHAIAIYPTLASLVKSMKKIYFSKSLDIELNCAEELTLSIDETDLMEIIGNILDNACKAASTQVQLDVEKTAFKTLIKINDDGPGLLKSEFEMLLKRGGRLDTYAEGQGIGLALTHDLVEAYNGTLSVQQSTLTGCAIHLEFNKLTQ